MEGFIMSLEKISLVIRNKLCKLSNEELLYKSLEKNDLNDLTSLLAISELIKRNPLTLNIDYNFLVLFISKLTIEDIWSLVISNPDTALSKAAKERLIKILDYYDHINEQETIKEKLYLIK